VNPREYQTRAISETVASIHERPVLTLPTGAGKTFCAVKIIEAIGLPTLFIAHRRELIGQAVRALKRNGAQSVGVIMAGVRPDRSAQIQVASVQTLVRRKAPDAGLIVIDECHHVTEENTYGAILNRSSGLRLGLTATPFRSDGRGLGRIFGKIICPIYADDLVRDGFLLEPIVYAPKALVNMDGVAIKRGDFDISETAARVEGMKITGDVVQNWFQYAAGKRTVLFAPNVHASKHYVEAFVRAGVQAEHLDGNATNRLPTLERWRSGETVLVGNCALFGEGFDLPELEVCIDVQPTRSMLRHLQKIGRVVRTANDKTGAVIIDHADNHRRLNLFMTTRLSYTLDDQATPQREHSEGRSTVKRCPGCYMLVPSHAQTCGGCGHEFKGELPKHVEGELEQITARTRPSIEVQQHAWTMIDSRRIALSYKEGWSYLEFERRYGFSPLVHDGRVYDPLTAPQELRHAVFNRFDAIRRERGYKPGWTAFRYKAVFGRWPAWRAS
jgi:superfamily II DNA or RNA helicase